MKGLRLYLELAVVLAVGVFAYVKIAPRWNGFFSPLKPAEAPDVAPAAPEPGEKPGSAAPALPAPALPDVRPRAAGQNMLVVPEDSRDRSRKDDYSGEPALKGSDQAPRVFERAPIAKDSLALARPAPTSSARLQPAWLTALESVDPRVLLAVVVAVFAVLYALGVAALRKGPGGKGLTHD